MRRRRLTMTGATLLALTALGPPAMSQAAEPHHTKNTITLITGDSVSLLAEPGGGTAIEARPAPGRENIGFTRTVRGKDTFVIPTDAIANSRQGGWIRGCSTSPRWRGRASRLVQDRCP